MPCLGVSDTNRCKASIVSVQEVSGMGMVVSSVVSGGPSVLEDLDTPYSILLERRAREKEKQNSKSWQKKQKINTKPQIKEKKKARWDTWWK